MTGTGQFDFENDIPSELWDLVDEAGGDPKLLRDCLQTLPRALFVRIFEGFVEAKVELVDRLVTSKRAGGASEDTLDDLADSLVFSGKKAYAEAFAGRSDLPARDGWHKLPGATSVFCEVFTARFAADIFDELDLE